MTQGFTANIDAGGFYGLTPLGPTLPNVKLLNGFAGSLGTGDNDLYTVPAGRRALIVNLLVFANGGVTFTIFPQIKISGTYYRLGTGNTISTNNSATMTANSYVAEAGEILSVNTNNVGANVWARIVEFENSSCLSSRKLTSLSAGNNTLYTVASGKSANIYAATFVPTTLPTLTFWNNSGGTRTVNVFNVPNGGSSGTSNQSAKNISIGNGTVNITGLITAPALNSGDFIVVNTDASTATQFCFATVCEI